MGDCCCLKYESSAVKYWFVFLSLSLCCLGTMIRSPCFTGGPRVDQMNGKWSLKSCQCLLNDSSVKRSPTLSVHTHSQKNPNTSTISPLLPSPQAKKTYGRRSTLRDEHGGQVTELRHLGISQNRATKIWERMNKIKTTTCITFLFAFHQFMLLFSLRAHHFLFSSVQVSSLVKFFFVAQSVSKTKKTKTIWSEEMKYCLTCPMSQFNIPVGFHISNCFHEDDKKMFCPYRVLTFVPESIHDEVQDEIMWPLFKGLAKAMNVCN